MKIIGGKKDFYDYLVSYYGYDDHIVYDRRNKDHLSYKGSQRFLFHFCGIKIPVIKKDNQPAIFEPEDPRLFEEKERWRINYDQQWLIKHKNKQTSLNSEKRQPVLCDAGLWKQQLFIPCLQDFDFPSIMSANEAYERIYAFLGWLKDNPEIPNDQTDKEKVVSHGFSLRESFRPKIKD